MIGTRIYSNRSICDCGEIVLNDSVPIGKVYEVDEDSIRSSVFGCGGCGKFARILAILARDDSGAFRPLPLGIFTEPETVN